MNKIFFSLLLIVAMFSAAVPVQAVAAQNFYLVPIEQIGTARGPEYFAWRFDDDAGSLTEQWSMMDYGFLNNALVLAFNMSQADHDALCAHADVYCFPDNIDTAANQSAKTFVETINVPSDWTTPSTTNREFLRKMAGLFQFNQRYSAICGASLFGNGITLDSNWNNLSAAQKTCFNNTVTAFGLNLNVQGNPKLRSLAKSAGDLWGDSPFFLGGFEF